MQGWNADGDRAIERVQAASERARDNREFGIPEMRSPSAPPARFSVELIVVNGEFDICAIMEERPQKKFVVVGVEWEVAPVTGPNNEVVEAPQQMNMVQRYRHMIRNNSRMMDACKLISKSGEGLLLIDFRKVLANFPLGTKELHQLMPMLFSDFIRDEEHKDFAGFKYKLLNSDIEYLVGIWIVNEEGYADVDVGGFETNMSVAKSSNINQIGMNILNSDWICHHTSIVEIIRDFWVSRDCWRKFGVFDLRGLANFSVGALHLYESARDLQLFPESPVKSCAMVWVSKEMESEKAVVADADMHSQNVFSQPESRLIPTDETNWRRAFVKKVCGCTWRSSDVVRGSECSGVHSAECDARKISVEECG